MQVKYDMCIDLDTLYDVNEKLRKIENSMIESVTQMSLAINKSKGFLEGEQFERAKMITEDCIAISKTIVTNIKNASLYLLELRKCIEQYGKCTYDIEGR